MRRANNALSRLVRAGLLTGVTDGLFSSVLSIAFYGSTVTRLFQGVASTLLGKEAFEGGTLTALLGVLMHFGVAFAWSAVFLLLVMRSSWIPRVLQSPYGVVKIASLYGPFIWLVMSLLIIPLLLHRPSAINIRWWVQLLGHIPFVGATIAASIGRQGDLMSFLNRYSAVLVLTVVAALSVSCSQGYEPGLGELMTLNQMRHAKLWFAGQARNWELADYELDELEEGFSDVVKFHPTHKDVELPISDLVPRIMNEPLKQLRAAIQARDPEAFARAYDSVTAGCNNCHQATKFGFNVVRRPSGPSWFGNQDFVPSH